MEFDKNLLSDKLELLNQLLPYDGWEVVDNTENVDSRKKFLPASSYACFRSIGIISSPMDELVDTIWKTYDNLSNVKEFDTDIVQYRIIKNIDENTRLCHQVNNLPWPLWPRDMIYFQHRLEKDGITYILMYSIDSNDVPCDNNKYVRATINISAYTFEKSSIGTIVNRFLHVDPAGNIPLSIVYGYSNKTRKLLLHLMK